MELRLMAAAVLFHGEDVLMMKRSERRTLNPGLWATVGGHMEPHELSSPKMACMREIYEETGFAEQDVADLRLRYVLMRNSQGEYRQQFIYVGRAKRRDFHATDEGELHWIPVEELLDRPIPYTFEQMLQHYIRNRESDHVWMGIVHRDGEADKPDIAWTPLTDPLT